MYESKKISGNTSRGFEFLKIYGITLVTAFLLMAAIRYRLSHLPTNCLSQPAESSEFAQPPVASHDVLFPLQKMKKIFVNLSF